MNSAARFVNSFTDWVLGSCRSGREKRKKHGSRFLSFFAVSVLTTFIAAQGAEAPIDACVASHSPQCFMEEALAAGFATADPGRATPDALLLRPADAFLLRR